MLVVGVRVGCSSVSVVGVVRGFFLFPSLFLRAFATRFNLSKEGLEFGLSLGSRLCGPLVGDGDESPVMTKKTKIKRGRATPPQHKLPILFF